MANTIFLTQDAGWAFPYIREDGTIQRITFGAGLNTIDDEALFDQVVSHPDTEYKVDMGLVVLFDGRKDSKESDLGLELVDVKGEHAEDGVPIAEINTDKATNPMPEYRKSKNTSGTTKKSTKSAYAYGDNPLPSSV